MNTCPHASLVDHDTYAEGIPHTLFASLRREDPVYWHHDPQRDEGFWCVTRQREVDLVSKNPEIFSSEASGIRYLDEDPAMAAQRRLMMVFMDPPYHRIYRKAIDQSFKPNVIEGMLGDIELMCTRIIDKVAARGECEFVSEVAKELPLQAICELMGVPMEDRQLIAHWSDIIMAPDDPDFATSFEELVEAGTNLTNYGRKIAQMQRERPVDNLSRRILDARVDGKRLSEDEFCAFFRMLLVGGNETVRNTTSSGMRLLMEHPDQLALLVAQPELIADAIEEMLRYQCPIIYFRRTAMTDTELGGKQIKKGDKVLMWYSSANFDETQFADPLKFDVTRPQREKVRQGHRAFGIGEHFCIGSHLARLELNVLFRQILARLRNPRMTAPPVKIRSFFIDAIKAMPITFDPEVAAAIEKPPAGVSS